MKTLVVVPVFNEAATLGPVLERILHFNPGHTLAVDDGSTDGSAAILESVRPCHIIRHETNLGYGRSLIDGFTFAVERGYELVITIDCDEQHEPCLIPRMFDRIGAADVLSGSRYLEDDRRGDPPPEDRRAINQRITAILNQITGYGLTDSFCGFKCYKTAALARLALDEPGYAMPLQFWIQAWRQGLVVKEIAVPRIYKNLDRTFGGEMDDPQRRLRHYLGVMRKELERWSMSSSLEHIPTI